MRIINIEKTGREINRRILEKGLSIKDVAEALNLAGTQSIYKWYKGYSLPDIGNMVLLVDLLGCTIDELLVVEDK